MDMKKEKITFNNIILITSFILLLVDLFIRSNIYNDLIKVQDIVAIIVVLYLIYIIKKLKQHNFNNYIILVFSLYIIYLFSSNIIHYYLNSVNYLFVFYILKEVEFFVFMLLGIYILYNFKRLSINLFTILISLNIIYGFYQILKGSISYYGIRSIVTHAPAGSAAVFFLSTILLFYFYKIKDNFIYLLLALSSNILLLATVSRTYIIGIIIFFGLYFAINIYMNANLTMKKNYIINFTIVLLLIIIIFFFSVYFFQNAYTETIKSRFSHIKRGLMIRFNKQIEYYNTLIKGSPISYLFGRGKSSPEYLIYGKSLAVDNQHTRAFFEMGLFGMILWYSVFILIMIELIRLNNKSEIVFYASLLFTYLIMGFAMELFQTTISGLGFWLTTGLLLGNSYYRTYSEQVNTENT